MTYLEYYFRKDRAGSSIFCSWGTLGSFGIIISEDQKVILSKLIEMKLGAIIIGAPIVTLILLNITNNLVVLLLGILAYSLAVCTIYYFNIHKITKSLPSSERLSSVDKVKINSEQQQKFLKTFSFFKIFSAAIVFIILGLLALSVLRGGSKNWLGAVFLVSLSFVMLIMLACITLNKLKEAQSIKTNFKSNNNDFSCYQNLPNGEAK